MRISVGRRERAEDGVGTVSSNFPPLHKSEIFHLLTEPGEKDEKEKTKWKKGNGFRPSDSPWQEPQMATT